MFNRTVFVTSSLPTSQKRKLRVIRGLALGHTASSGGSGLGIQTPVDLILYCPTLSPAFRYYTHVSG